MNHSITPLIAESERVLAEAISHFHLNVKPEQLTVTIQTRGRSKAAGWFAWDRWAGGTALAKMEEADILTGKVVGPIAELEYAVSPRHEINLSAECLHDCDMGMVLLHEICHAEAFVTGVKDVDKNGKVHNLKFKELAERLGLNCQEKDKKVGWGNTTLGSEGKKFLDGINFKRELFELFRLPLPAQAKAETRMLKLVCPDDACGYIIRTTRGHIAKGCPTCVCGNMFEQEKVEEEEEA